MSGVIVDTRTGEFVVSGDFGDLASILSSFFENGVTYYKVFAEDEAFAIFS